ncbi:MAG: DUF1566 domain-containing protein [Nitrospirae bacterium]|nr:DUF1566 domain-containing protein [Nitrospirota bacterium]
MDWRLPNVKELESILDDTLNNPSIDQIYFPGTQSLNYWSSTSFANPYSNGYAWKVAFNGGDIGNSSTFDSSINNSYVRCVRSAAPVFTPLYRLYKGVLDKDHFYTTSAVERDTAAGPIMGYTYEKVEGYISRVAFQGGVALYRLYNSSTKTHYYTTDSSVLPAGFAREGVTGYIYASPTEGMVPLYHAYKALDTDNFYTVSKPEYTNAVNNLGYTDANEITGYVSLSQVANNRPQGNMMGVDLFSGSYQTGPIVDMKLEGAGPDLSFVRYYNSFSFSELPLSPGWSHNLYNYIDEDNDVAGIVAVRWGDGTDSYFKNNGSNSFTGLWGAFGTFERDGVNDGYILTTKNQTRYVFRRLSVNNNPGQKFMPSMALSWIQDRYGNKLNFEYHPTSKLLTAVYKQLIGSTSNQRFDFLYDGSMRISRVTDNLGRYVTFSYDATSGNLSSAQDARGNATSYSYYTSSDSPENVRLLKSITYPELNTVTVAYDTQQRVTSSTNGGINMTFDYTNGTTVTTPQGNISHTHDTSFRMTQTQYPGPLGSSTVVPQYSNTGNLMNKPASIKDRNDKSTSFTYDANGNIASATNALSQTTTNTYDQNNNLRTVTDALGHTTTYNYDASLIKLLSVVKPLGGTTTYDYYANGRVMTVTETATTGGSHVLTYTYDVNGNPLSISDNVTGAQVSFIYDNAGRMTKKTDQLGKVTDYSYDANDNLIQITQATSNGAVTSTFNFDKNNRMTWVKDPKGQTTGSKTTYAYNTSNQMISVTDQVGKLYQYAYDAKGNLITVTDPNNDVISYSYNATDNRPYQVKFNGTAKITYSSYDNNGNLLSMFEDSGTARNFVYDSLNRMTSYTDSFGQTVSYLYDAAGNISRITYPGSGKLVNYGYDNDNNLKTVTDWLGTTTYNYDTYGSGILQSVTNPNGTTSIYTYDSANRLTGLSNKKANSTLISDYSFTLNNVGNPMQSNINQPKIPTLTAANVSSTYDDANKLTSAFTFDNRGNIAAGSGNTFSFDYANRLTGATVGGTTYSYLYDGFGNRIARTQAGTQTRYVLDINGDMSDVLAETDSSGTIQNYYIYGHGLISKITSGGLRYVYHYDSLGNTVAVTDSTGAVVEQYGYDEFGKATPAASYSNPFRYVGKYGVMDEGNGLLFMRARYYDVENGRFISKDPIGFEGGDLNLYAYVGGNPVVGIDPEGLATDNINTLKKMGGYAISLIGKSKVEIIKDLSNKFGVSDYLGNQLYKYYLSPESGYYYSQKSDNDLDLLEKNLNQLAVSMERAYDVGKFFTKIDGLYKAGLKIYNCADPKFISSAKYAYKVTKFVAKNGIKIGKILSSVSGQ